LPHPRARGQRDDAAVQRHRVAQRRRDRLTLMSCLPSWRARAVAAALAAVVAVTGSAAVGATSRGPTVYGKDAATSLPVAGTVVLASAGSAVAQVPGAGGAAHPVPPGGQAQGQGPGGHMAQGQPVASPGDVASPDALLQAFYASIS